MQNTNTIQEFAKHKMKPTANRMQKGLRCNDTHTYTQRESYTDAGTDSANYCQSNRMKASKEC